MGVQALKAMEDSHASAQRIRSKNHMKTLLRFLKTKKWCSAKPDPKAKRFMWRVIPQHAKRFP